MLYNTRKEGIMNRVALMFAAMVSVFLVTDFLGQEIRMPKNVFPPEISPPVITVTGIDGKATSVTLADLSNLPQQTLRVTEHGTPITYEGVLLSDVLALVQTPTGDAFRQPAASSYVVVKAVDGYKAVFSWAEADPTFTDQKVYLLVRRDAQPMPGGSGPFLIAAPGDKRRSRWVRQVSAVTIKQAN